MHVCVAYSCDPAVCKAPDCHCPTQSSPLPVDQTPQFILFTHDDSTGDLSTSLMNQAIGKNTNPNGCKIPVTYFTMQAYSTCERIQEAWNAGDEIAGHTISHEPMDMKYKFTEQEIVGLRDWIINECGIPAEDVVGHRSPYLVNNPKHRQALEKGGFLYDSTINEHWPDQTLVNSEPNTVSPNGKSKLWPYTMDNGIPQNCAWTGNLCTEEESYKGLWEVPVWNIQTDKYPENAYALDPCDAAKIKCDPLELLKSNFELAYTGNRAPVPLYVHSPWLQEAGNMKDVQEFITWVRENHPTDTYFVTMHQLVQWMQNPVPISKMNEWLGCTTGGNAAGAINRKSDAVQTAPVAVADQAVALAAAIPEPVAPAVVPEPVIVAAIPQPASAAVVPDATAVVPTVAAAVVPQAQDAVAAVASPVPTGQTVSLPTSSPLKAASSGTQIFSISILLVLVLF